MIFFFVYFLIYGGMNLYAFRVIKSAFPFSAIFFFSFKLWIGFMIISPFIVRLLQNNGRLVSATLAAYPAYLWMAFVFLFFICSVFFTITGIFVRIPPLFTCLISISIACFVLIIGWFQADDICLKRIEIKTGKFRNERIIVCQISDIHAGLTTNMRRFIKMIDMIQSIHPDVLVCSGDLYDGRSINTKEMLGLLKTVKPRLGKFAVLGNHEFYAGADDAEKFITEAGFKLLRNASFPVNEQIEISGVDDPAFGLNFQDQKLLEKTPKAKFIIFLKHRPEIPKAFKIKPDLILSGHTHGGQIFPFNFIVKMLFPVKTGELITKYGINQYVSYGTGTWGPPVRFLAPPEIVVFEIIHG